MTRILQELRRASIEDVLCLAMLGFFVYLFGFGL